MKAYLITYKFYYDGELKSERCSTRLLEAPCAEEISGDDFQGLWDLVYKYACFLQIGMWEFKRGKPFLQFNDALFARITPKNCKPWKLVITSEEINLSMQKLMSFDAEKVIQYLKERGITTCPIMK